MTRALRYDLHVGINKFEDEKEIISVIKGRCNLKGWLNTIKPILHNKRKKNEANDREFSKYSKSVLWTWTYCW